MNQAADRPARAGRPFPVRDDEDEALLVLAPQAAAEDQEQHGQPITRDALRARLASPVRSSPSCYASSAPPKAACRLPHARPDHGGRQQPVHVTLCAGLASAQPLNPRGLGVQVPGSAPRHDLARYQPWAGVDSRVRVTALVRVMVRS
jgi:hypothetical protein